VAPTWLLSVYLLQACGEVVLAPVGISAAAAAAPAAFAARTVSLWWLFSAFGVGLGSQVVRLTTVVAPQVYYLGLGLAALAVGAGIAAGGGFVGRGHEGSARQGEDGRGDPGAKDRSDDQLARRVVAQLDPGPTDHAGQRPDGEQ
jgi:POT family